MRTKSTGKKLGNIATLEITALQALAFTATSATDVSAIPLAVAT